MHLARPLGQIARCNILLLLVILTGCNQVKVDEPLRIGISPWPGYDIIYYAEYKGLFKEAGLNVQLRRFDNLEDSSRAFLRGQLDAVFSSSWDVMQLPITENDIHVVLVTNTSSGADGIVGAPHIKSVKDLAGKRVACQIGIISHTILLEALKLHGVDPDEVKLVDVSNELGNEMLSRGDVDAAVLWEPLLSNAARQVSGNVIFTTKDVQSNIVDNLLTRKNISANKRTELKAFIGIWFDIVDQIKTNPNETLEQIATYLGEPPQDFIKGYNGIIIGDLEMNQTMLGEQRQLHATLNRLAETMSTFTKDINTNVYSSAEYLPENQ